MTGSAVIFFILFALSIVLAYLAVRRSWASIEVVIALGLIAGIVSMFLFSIAQGNQFAQALVVGVLLGAVFVTLSVSVARFFRASENRSGQ